jgi:hypothetical protein
MAVLLHHEYVPSDRPLCTVASWPAWSFEPRFRAGHAVIFAGGCSQAQREGVVINQLGQRRGRREKLAAEPVRRPKAQAAVSSPAQAVAERSLAPAAARADWFALPHAGSLISPGGTPAAHFDRGHALFDQIWKGYCNIAGDIYHDSVRLVLATMVAAIRSDAGASRRLLLAALDGRFTILVSVPLMIEYEAVMTRVEHLNASRLSADDIAAVLDAVAEVAEPVELAFLWRCCVTRTTTWFLRRRSTVARMESSRSIGGTSDLRPRASE